MPPDAEPSLSGETLSLGDSAQRAVTGLHSGEVARQATDPWLDACTRLLAEAAIVATLLQLATPNVLVMVV
jgi:hypothetical protein